MFDEVIDFENGLIILYTQFGRPSPSISDPNADVNNDRVANVFDIVVVAANFGKASP